MFCGQFWIHGFFLSRIACLLTKMKSNVAQQKPELGRASQSFNDSLG